MNWVVDHAEELIFLCTVVAGGVAGDSVEMATAPVMAHRVDHMGCCHPVRAEAATIAPEEMRRLRSQDQQACDKMWVLRSAPIRR